MNRPNLFSYATSELSQDAFICWLLSWASSEYKNTNSDLHDCSVNFIHALFEKHSKTAPPIIEKIEVFKQDKNIDILFVVNDRYAILIEDKTGTKNHSNQLVRYLEEVKNRHYKEEDILPIYFKTEDQDDYADVLDKGYKLFLRSDFLNILNTYSGKNSILLDYRDNLQSISDAVESYQLSPINKWGWYSWVGFYLRLQNEIGSAEWDYVANKKGGFLGFWWNLQGDDNCKQYLQLEQGKLCFKIWVNNSSDRSTLRSKWYKTIQEKGSECGFNVVKPSRFGNGQYMTVCIYGDEYRECNDKNIVDIDKSVHRLRKAEALLEAVKLKA